MADLTDNELASLLAAERSKLGPNAAERIRAVEAYVAAQAGDRGKDIVANLITAAQIEGFEKLMASSRAQQRGAEQQHREPPQEQGKWSEEQYQKASPAERLDYTRQFPQQQFQPTKGAGRQLGER
jgi:hypothetical protein